MVQVVKAAVDPDMQADADKLGRPCLHHTCNVYEKCNTIEQHQQQLTPEVAEVAYRLGMVIMPYQEVYLRALGPVSVSLQDRLQRTPAWVASLAAAGEAGEVQQAAADAADTLNALPATQAELLLDFFSPQREQPEAEADVASGSGSYASLSGLQQQSGMGSSHSAPVANLAAAFAGQADSMPVSESEPAGAATSSQASAAAAADATADSTAAAGPEVAEEDGPVQAAAVDFTPEQCSDAASWMTQMDQASAASWPNRLKKAAKAAAAAKAANKKAPYFDYDPNHVPVSIRQQRLPDSITGGTTMSYQVFCELFESQLGVPYVEHWVEVNGQLEERHYFDLTSYRANQQ